MRSLVALLALSFAFAGCLTPSAKLPTVSVVKPAAAAYTGATLVPLDFTSKDGTHIRGTAYLPKDAATGARFGVIAQLSPYFGTLYGITTAELLPPGRAFNLTRVGLYVGHGFAYVAANVPGTGDSGGCFSIGGLDERTRLAEFIDWLGVQPWSNGNVGVMGISYDGTTPWEVGIMAPSHLKTIVPMEGISDYYRYEYQDGAPYYYWGPLFFPDYYLDVGVGYGSLESSQSPPNPQTTPEHVCPIVLDHFTESEKTTETGVYDAFWQERNLTAGFAKIRASVLLIHGLADWNVKGDHADFFAALPKETRVWWGQWEHNIPYHNSHHLGWDRADWNTTSIAWFDHYLDGETNGVPDALPNVQYQDTDGLWRNATAWPPADANDLILNLNGVKLTTQAAPASDAPSMFVSVPDKVDDVGEAPTSAYALTPDSPSQTIAKFVSDPLADEVHVAGDPRLSLMMQVDRPGDAHVVVQLYNVSADGKWWWVDEGGRGLEQRHGRNASDSVAPMTDMRVPVAMYPSAVVFHKGERIGILVAGEDPNWFYSNGNEPVFTLEHDATHASTLSLPIVPADTAGLSSAEISAANPFFVKGTLDH
ncbi:MAG: CocE/NonD family hydrolase [Thermoplasmatota archaeon]